MGISWKVDSAYTDTIDLYYDGEKQFLYWITSYKSGWVLHTPELNDDSIINRPWVKRKDDAKAAVEAAYLLGRGDNYG